MLFRLQSLVTVAVAIRSKKSCFLNVFSSLSLVYYFALLFVRRLLYDHLLEFISALSGRTQPRANL